MKTSYRNLHFDHGLYLRVTTLENQILRIHIKNNMRKPLIRIYILSMGLKSYQFEKKNKQQIKLHKINITTSNQNIYFKHTMC